MNDLSTSLDILDAAVRRNTILDYYSRKSPHTVQSTLFSINTFAEFLDTLNVKYGNLWEDPAAWAAITWGQVELFKQWMLMQGFKISTLNLKLGTIKLMIRLAAQAHAVSHQVLSDVNAIKGYTKAEAQRIDNERTHRGIETSKHVHKDEHNILTLDQANSLKLQPKTPQGWRDCLMMCLFIDHALRREELHLLNKSSFYQQEYTKEGVSYVKWAVRIVRPKVHKTQSHLLSPDTELAFLSYLEYCKDTDILWRVSLRSGQLLDAQIGLGSINERVQYLGYTILGIENLSPHDLRHYAVTAAARLNDRRDLVEFGGWNSDHMLSVYVHDQEFSNDGIKLPPPVLVKGE